MMVGDDEVCSSQPLTGYVPKKKKKNGLYQESCVEKK